MEVVITAVGPDNAGLADPIIHYVTGQGASIAEIQMYDHDDEAMFAMLCRIKLNTGDLLSLRENVVRLGESKGLSVRAWSRDERPERPRLAICSTYRPEPASAVLESVADGTIRADVALMMGNRDNGSKLAIEHNIPWRMIGDLSGKPDEMLFEQLLDEYEIDYVILARYMRVLPAGTCWKFAGGRIINLHHGLLPGFPGMRPYHDAYASRMLTFGATCHFIVPELDAGNQIVNQRTFAVPPGTDLQEIIRIGQRENEPACLVEGIRRIVDREVQLHFHRVTST